MLTKNFLKPRNILIFLVLAIITFSTIIFLGDYKDITSSFYKLDFKIFIVLISLVIGNQLIRFVKWNFLLSLLKIRPKFVDSFLIFTSGFSMSITPGKIGETVKCYLLNKTCKTNYNVSLPVVVVERLTDLIGLLVLTSFGISSVFLPLKFLIVLPFLIFGFILFITNEKIFFRLVDLLFKINFFKKYLHNIKVFHSSIKILLSPRSLLVTLTLSTLAWSLEGLGLYLLLVNLGVNVDTIQIISIYSFSLIAGALSFLPGGVGVTEGSLLSLLLLMNVPKSLSSLATIIIRVVTLWFGVSVGLISLSLISRKFSKLL